MGAGTSFFYYNKVMNNGETKSGGPSRKVRLRICGWPMNAEGMTGEEGADLYNNDGENNPPDTG